MEIADYVSKYFGAIMHVDTLKFALAVANGDTETIEKEYEDLCNIIITEHAHHHEEINRHFDRMRVYVSMHFSGRDTKPPTLPYVFFGV